MARYHRHGIESTASIAGHPLHPMLVPFPIAFLIGALVTDLAFRFGSGNLFWANASWWLLLAGLVMGALAAVPGLIDFSTIPEARREIGWVHFIGNGLALLITAWNLALRWNDAVVGLLGGGIWLSLATVLILSVTGWIGGELAYRHRIGMSADAGTGDATLRSHETARHRMNDGPGASA